MKLFVDLPLVRRENGPKKLIKLNKTSLNKHFLVNSSYFPRYEFSLILSISSPRNLAHAA